MELVVGHTCRLREEKLLSAVVEYRKESDGEQYNAQSSNPLRQTSPEKQSVGQGFDVVEDSGSGGRESRHRFEKGIGDGGNVTAEIERKHSKNGEQQPAYRYDAIAVASVHMSFGSFTPQEHTSTNGYVDENSVDEVQVVAFPVA